MTSVRTRVPEQSPGASVVRSGPRPVRARVPALPCEGTRSGGLNLTITRPRAGLTVLTAAGELDSSNIADFADVLWPALLVDRSSIVLDLTGVAFLGVPGLELLSAAHSYAPHRELAIVLLSGGPAVERAVRAGSPEVALRRAPDLAAAFTSLARELTAGAFCGVRR